MSKLPFFGKLESEVTMEDSPGASEAHRTFRVAILGDFSGRANRGLCEPSSRLVIRLEPVEVDRDNFDNILAKLGVRLNLTLAGEGQPRVAIEFNCLDDFHPDRIVDRVGVFQSLTELRKRLHEHSEFAAAAAEVRAWTRIEGPSPFFEPAPDQTSPPRETLAIPAGNLLERMLQETESGAQKAPETRDEQLQSFLREVVEPYLAPGEEPDRPALIACVDQAMSELMRAILHHPDFQAIEAAWRALYLMVSRLETGADLKLHLVDISKPELAADLGSSDDLRSTATYKVLVEDTVETPGGEAWGVLVGNYSFDRTREDAELLGRIAKIAGRAGAPFISEASDRVLGCESLAATPDPRDWHPSDSGDDEAWEALRGLPEASYLGLALPRFLLRLPYGADTDPVEQFSFEEMPEASGHHSYLWGNPSFACAYLLGAAFSQYGWDFRPGLFQEIDGLPMHVYQENDESRVKPCAEVLLTERSAEAILNQGIMPLLSFRGRDSVRLARFQSLADPLTPLAGQWVN